MVIVRDYDVQGTRWIVWRAQSLQSAYTDYPYTGISGFPAVSSLAGQLHVTADQPTLADDYLDSVQASSLWLSEDYGTSADYTPGFNLSGHTGMWGLSVYETGAGEPVLRGLVQTGDDYVPQTQEDGFGTILTTENIEVYPLDTGLPDSLWLSIGEDLVLNSAETI
jgi:hypothetical protein